MTLEMGLQGYFIKDITKPNRPPFYTVYFSTATASHFPISNMTNPPLPMRSDHQQPDEYLHNIYQL